MYSRTSFRLLWIGQALANVADVFYIVAVIALVYQSTGSAVSMTLVPFFITAAMFASGLVAPIWIDLFRLKSLLLYTQLGKTVALLLLVLFGEVLSRNGVHSLFLIVFVVGFLDGTANPVRNSLVPFYVEPSGLVKANSFLSVMDQSIQLAGWSVGGLLIIALGANGLVGLVLTCCAASTVCMGFLRPVQRDNTKSATHTKWDSIKEGWVIVSETKTVRLLISMDFLETVASVVWIAAILYIYVDQVLHTGEEWWGYINASFFTGLIVGGALCFRLHRLVGQHLSSLVTAGLLGGGLSTLLFGWLGIPTLALVLSALHGLAVQLKDTSEQTIFQTGVPKHEISKVYSVRSVIVTGTFGVASLLFGWVTDAFGVQVAFTVAAAIVLGAAAISMFNRDALSGGSAEIADDKTIHHRYTLPKKE